MTSPVRVCDLFLGEYLTVGYNLSGIECSDFNSPPEEFAGTDCQEMIQVPIQIPIKEGTILNNKLSREDKAYIWQVVHHAVEKAGSHASLFANRLEFFEESGRIRFHWPVWMHAIKGYLVIKYGEKQADNCLLDILREVMSESNYQAFLRQAQDGRVSFPRGRAKLEEAGRQLKNWQTGS